MKLRIALTGCAAIVSLLTVGCYNNPETSLKKPGEGPENVHARPAVGPGTTPGGSTAGPQPAKVEQGADAAKDATSAPEKHAEGKH